MAVRDKYGLIAEPSDIEGIGVRRGYWFGLRDNDGRIDVRVPEQPGIPIAIAHAAEMDKYPFGKGRSDRR